MKTHYRIVESRLVSRVCEGTAFEIIGQPIKGAADIVEPLQELIGDKAKETFMVVLLNGMHRVIAFEEVSIGTATTALVHPREVFGAALRLGAAAAIIVAHNHPSGDTEPSEEDHQVTKRLKDAGTLLGVPVLDHLIVGPDLNYYSFASNGKL